MHELTDSQWDELRKLHKLASLADMETDAALYSGSLDDATPAIQAVLAAADALHLPDGLASNLQALAQEAWNAAEGTGDTKNRAGIAMGAVDRIEQMIESQFAAAKRRL
jgi:hypothetical protein